MLEQANEVQEVLGRSYGLPEDVDEDDLEAGGNCVEKCRSRSCIRYPRGDILLHGHFPCKLEDLYPN